MTGPPSSLPPSKAAPPVRHHSSPNFPVIYPPLHYSITPFLLHPMKHPSASLLLAGLLAGLSLSPAFAGAPVTASSKDVLMPTPAHDDWYLKLGVYMWTSSVSGDAGIGGVTFPADMKFKDILEELDFGYQGYF